MRILVLSALCVLAGCVAAPPASSPVAPSAALAASSPATQESASGATTSEKSPDAAESAKRTFKPPAGYKTKILGWNVVYCRKTTVLGSRFPKEICMTEAELKAHLAKNEEMREDMSEAGRICAQAAGCAFN